MNNKQDKGNRMSLSDEGVANMVDALKRKFNYVKPDDRVVGRVRDYKPGDWFKAQTIDEMQVFFLSRLPAIRDAARAHGYAIGLHGSARRDFDLMAMPWIESASNKDELAHAIAVAACGITREGPYVWEKKPNGRSAVSICICWTDHANPDFRDMIGVGHIDLSVIEHT